MNVLHVISTLSGRYGGPATVLQSLAHAQAEHGHRITICTTNLDYPTGVLDVPTDEAVRQGHVTVRYHRLTLRPLYVSVPFANWLFQHIRDFDIVHVHGLYRFPPTFAAALARHRKVPYLIRPHGSLDPFLYKQSRYNIWAKRLYERLFDFPNLQHAGAIHYTSEEEAARVSFLDFRAPAVVVSNGLDWRDFSELPEHGRFRDRLGLSAEQPLILFLGRLNFKKGLDLLIPAFAQVLSKIPGAFLAVVGPDNDGLGPEVRRWCAEQGVADRVRFIDHIPPDQTREAYVDADVFALTSYTENTGMTVVEAMACGCPVVISDQVNIWRQISGVGAGAVVPLDIPKITEALVGVLTDPEAARRMGAAGRRLAEEQFSWKNLVGQFDRVYEALVRGEPLS